MSADLKQVNGADIETGDFEVGLPTRYEHPFDHKRFSDATRKYFGLLIGSGGAGIAAMSRLRIRLCNKVLMKELNSRSLDGGLQKRKVLQL